MSPNQDSGFSSVQNYLSAVNDYLKQEPSKGEDADFAELEAVCNMAGARLISYQRDPRVLLIGTHASFASQDSPIASVIRDNLEENDSVMFPYEFRGRILTGLDMMKGFVSLIHEELQGKNAYVIANDDPAIVCQIADTARDLDRLVIGEAAKTDIDKTADRLLILYNMRENNFLYSKWGIIPQLELSRKVFQVLPVKHLASQYIAGALQEKGISYCEILPG
ncbi:hypothetical protein JW968_06880 [Candidatus Woesearchaeota archaeon]|nr:hypothetical protein [Candidatus Woesearchaeota archaeon]